MFLVCLGVAVILGGLAPFIVYALVIEFYSWLFDKIVG